MLYLYQCDFHFMSIGKNHIGIISDADEFAMLRRAQHPDQPSMSAVAMIKNKVVGRTAKVVCSPYASEIGQIAR
jgi:hypothetical protein